MKEQYSSATTMNSELCVMIHGMTMMQVLCVNSLDTQVSVTCYLPGTSLMCNNRVLSVRPIHTSHPVANLGNKYLERFLLTDIQVLTKLSQMYN